MNHPWRSDVVRGGLALMLVLAVPGSGEAAGAFRCPTTGRLISLGASTLEVRARCREPDEARSAVEVRTIRERVRRWIAGESREVTEERTVEIPIDDWTYDFGRNRFIQYLRFENGRLTAVGDGPKGSGEPE
jgi:hypothetical protein